MRITNSILSREALSGFRRQMQALDEARREATTGLRVSRPSDDPVAVAGIMQSSSGLRALEQYQRNLAAGQARLEIEDSVLGQLTNALTRAKELAISQATDTATGATRQVTGSEVVRVLDLVKDLANTRLAGSYVFGGQYADSAPFQGGAVDPTRPPSGSFQVEVGSKLYVDTNHSAQEVFLDSDAVESLQALATALNSDDVPGIQAALTRIDGAFNEVQNLTGNLGGRMNQLDVAMTNLESLEVNLQTFRSELQDADITEAVTKLVERQGSLEAAMLANSKILNLTMTDYLR